MQQRVHQRTWESPDRPGQPRLLIESEDPVLAISDFSAFTDAGFQVALCSGPATPGECPLLRDGDCDLVADADVILNGLTDESGSEIAEAVLARRPYVPVVVQSRRGTDGKLEPVPDGCIPLVTPSSVGRQVDAVRRAAFRRH